MADIKPPKPFSATGDQAAENYKLWLQQFEWYAIATEFETKKPEIQVAIFMASLGSEVTAIFNNFKLAEADKKNLKKIVEKFSEHFTPKRNIIFERYTFHKICQEELQYFDDFLTNIKTQAQKCDFKELHDEMVRDKIVIGINNNNTREKLLTLDVLSLDEAVKICRAAEATMKQLKVMEENSDARINVIKRQKEKPFKCSRCGGSHEKFKCPAYDKNCQKCLIKGHSEKMCKTSMAKIAENKKKAAQPNVNAIANDDSDEDSFYVNVIRSTAENEKARENHFDVYTINSNSNDWIEIFKFNNTLVKVKLDTGAQVNVMPKNIAQKFKKKIDVSSTKYLKSFSQHKIAVEGEMALEGKARNGVTSQILFKIVDYDDVPIISYKTCNQMGFLNQINTIQLNSEFKDIFTGLGCLQNFEYDIDLVENPKFEIKSARKIPQAIKKDVKLEIDRMEKMGVIRKTKKPTPVVSQMVVVNSKNKIRICIDPLDVKKNLKRRHYPLKTLEQIISEIGGAKVFTKLDCNKGFWQIKVSERTSDYLTFATPWGRYSFTRLPFGLASAPEVFQEVMSSLFENVENTYVSMDDILIYANSLEELERHTNVVFKVVSEAGLILNKDKCEFGKEKIKFLGHILSQEGVQSDPDKIQAIKQLKTPSNKKQLQRLLEPLRELLKLETYWKWEVHHDAAFDKLKDRLCNTPVLAYYDVNKDVVLSVDASSTAVGAVLIQDDRPVAYATKALNTTQQKYPQIEKEALAIRIACAKFHEFIYGKNLTIETDHKPLESIFKKSIHKAPLRLQRILLDVTPYNPKIVYKKGTDLYIADTLSRDCRHSKIDVDKDDKSLMVNVILPISQQARHDMIEATKKDEELQKLLEIIQEGWPVSIKTVPNGLQKYWNFRDELTECDSLIFKGEKVVVPKSQIKRMLENIHKGHFGIEKSCNRARPFLFWYGMTSDIKLHVEQCVICQKTQRSNPNDPIFEKRIPEFPGQIVASDLFYFKGEQYLLIVDNFSGFFEFEKLKYATSEEVIETIKKYCSRFGIPEVFESDNGPQYASKLFKEFTKEWKFEHHTSSPAFPRSNGLAERYVQTAKNMLKKCAMDNSDIHLAILNYRNTVTSPELGSPNQRVFNRFTNDLLSFNKDLLKPKIHSNVSYELSKIRNKQKQLADKGNLKERKLPEIGDEVRVKKNHRDWVGGKIVAHSEFPRSVLVKTNNGNVLRRNQAHVNKTKAKFKFEPQGPVGSLCSSQENTEHILNNCGEEKNAEQQLDIEQTVQEQLEEENPADSGVDQPNTEYINVERVSKFGRKINKPNRLNL